MRTPTTYIAPTDAGGEVRATLYEGTAELAARKTYERYISWIHALWPDISVELGDNIKDLPEAPCCMWHKEYNYIFMYTKATMFDSKKNITV